MLRIMALKAPLMDEELRCAAPTASNYRGTDGRFASRVVADPMRFRSRQVPGSNLIAAVANSLLRDRSEASHVECHLAGQLLVATNQPFPST